jgi:hypothetical protein
LDDPVGLLNKAVETARAAGIDCDGWTMQGSGDGYAAWLYTEDEDSQTSLFEGVDILPSATAAAQWVLVRAAELGES